MAEEPKQVPEPKPEDDKPKTDPESSEGKIEVDKAYLEKVETSLKQAEHLIVEQKRELETLKKEDNADPSEDDLAALVKKHVEEAIQPLKEALTKKEEDPVLIKLRETQKQNEELKAALLKKNTSSGAGPGTNQDHPEPEPEVKLNDRELAILKRRGIDPKTVKL